MNIFLFFSLLFLLTPQKAQAYLDPGTGSLVIQFLVGGALGLVFLVKRYWGFFLGLLNKKSEKVINEKETSKEEDGN